MPILTLLNRVKDKTTHPPHPVINELLALRDCYLTGIAMQAHCDGVLSPEEHDHFLEMAAMFSMGADEAEKILESARTPDEKTVTDIRRTLLNSKYKYYFILDLQIMAQQDHEVKAVETEVLRRFGEILEIAREDRDFLVELADAVVSNDEDAKDRWAKAFEEKSKLAGHHRPEDFEHYM